jgi:carboxypeptidase Q
MRTLAAALMVAVATPTYALSPALPPPQAPDLNEQAAFLRDKALVKNDAYEIVTRLTIDIGPRLAATAAEEHARGWMYARMYALGLANVHIQTFAVPHWERGVETATTIGPNPQRLIVTTLGASGATPPGGIDADVVKFADLEELKTTQLNLTGKIVFIDHEMRPAQDGSSYGAFNAIRTAGPAIAASKGAAAYLHRSLATGVSRLPHTGVTRFPNGTAPIPAAALSVPDAMQLTRMIASGPVRLHLVLTPKRFAPGISGNVVGEITGAEKPHEVVLVGGHLDSWDLGTGAIDDGAGVAITLGAAKVIVDAIKDGTLLPPRRTIRVVAFGDEESAGPLGGATYLKGHPADTVVLAAESDFGADRVWSLRARSGAAPAVAALARVLAPLGIAPSPLPAFGGTDIEAAGEAGAAVIDLAQDGTRYFDLHHSADDTLDKIDPAAMTQNVAAWAAMLWWAANTDADLRPVKVP